MTAKHRFVTAGRPDIGRALVLGVPKKLQHSLSSWLTKTPGS